MGYLTITTKIVELLETITELAVVYDHNPNTLEEFPAATVTALGHKNRFNDTASNIRSYQYTIRLWYRLEDDDTAEVALQEVTDKVLEKLEAYVTVQDVWDIQRPSEAVFRTADREEAMLVSEITLAIEKRVNRNV